MKNTLEIPDALFTSAKSAAAQRGVSFRELVSEALSEKLRDKAAEEKPWMTSFGKLRRLREKRNRLTASSRKSSNA